MRLCFPSAEPWTASKTER